MSYLVTLQDMIDKLANSYLNNTWLYPTFNAFFNVASIYIPSLTLTISIIYDKGNQEKIRKMVSSKATFSTFGLKSLENSHNHEVEGSSALYIR